MPGMVIRYAVNEGDTVKEGDVVMILEAMKMENSILAPVSGTVKQILCQSAQSVQKGDVLAIIG
jgi:pyruvate carboxylase subunit B